MARSPWFASWFDSTHYHRLYAHRDEREAARFVDALVARLNPCPGAFMLDLGCGAGRHSKRLAARGFRVTGLDLAANSIRQARRFQRKGLHFFRHDMRVPFGRNAFEYVFNFFTSFGYFTPDEHLTVLRNVAASLKSGGRFVLDYLNVGQAASGVAREEVQTIEGVRYRLTRWADAGHFFKRIVIDSQAGTPIEYVERVARLGLPDFRRLLTAAGFRVEEVLGDYRLNEYDTTASPRLIVVARKADDRFLREGLRACA